MSFLSQPIQDVIFRFNGRKVGEIQLAVVISESTSDALTITKQPVQHGASITDHAYKEPTTLTMTAYQQDNSFFSFLGSTAGGLTKVYQQFIDLQLSRVPFDIVTPKRIYRSMLMASLNQTTDKNTENTLALNMSFQEVIIVSVSTTSVPRNLQKFAGVTGANENAGKKNASFLSKAASALTGLFSK